MPTPCLQRTPAEAAGSDGLVVDQDLVGVRDDLDLVVDGVDDPDVGLDGRGEDEVLRLAGPPRPGRDNAEDRVAAVGAVPAGPSVETPPGSDASTSAAMTPFMCGR
jgi:hypothetical protein